MRFDLKGKTSPARCTHLTNIHGSSEGMPPTGQPTAPWKAAAFQVVGCFPCSFLQHNGMPQ